MRAECEGVRAKALLHPHLLEGDIEDAVQVPPVVASQKAVALQKSVTLQKSVALQNQLLYTSSCFTKSSRFTITTILPTTCCMRPGTAFAHPAPLARGKFYSGNESCPEALCNDFRVFRALQSI